MTARVLIAPKGSELAEMHALMIWWVWVRLLRGTDVLQSRDVRHRALRASQHPRSCWRRHSATRDANDHNDTAKCVIREAGQTH